MLKKILLLTAILTVSSPMFGFDLRGEKFAIGFGSFTAQSFREQSQISGHDESKAQTAFPFIYYKNRRFEIDGLEARFDFSNLEKAFSWGVAIRYTGDLYEGAGVPNRRLSPFGGVFASYKNFRFKAIHGLTNAAVQGTIAELSYYKTFQLSQRIQWDIFAALEYYDSDYINYYFGVQSDEASFFPVYDSASGSINTIISTGANISIIGGLNLYFGLGYKLLGADVFKAPTTNEQGYAYLTSILSYRFY